LKQCERHGVAIGACKNELLRECVTRDETGITHPITCCEENQPAGGTRAACRAAAWPYWARREKTASAFRKVSGDFDCSPSGDDRNPYDGSCSTRFDLMASLLNNKFTTKPAMVESVEMDGVEGFTMRLSGDYTLAVFPADSDVSLDPRYWQLVKLANQ
jgi:hypothetical protein